MTITTTTIDVAKLFDQHHSKLVRIVRRKLIGMDDGLVEDAVMFAWEQLVRRGLDDYSQVLGWLVTVATHEAYSVSRKRGREAGDEPLFYAVSEASDPQAQVEARDEVALLAQLKPQQQVTLGLLGQGYSYREICEITGKTYTWVNRHIAEGKAALRDLAA